MTSSTPLIRETFPVGPLQCNCTIIGDPLSKKALVIDPGGDHQLILDRLQALGLQVVSIIHTHAHLDHFLASGEMKKATGATLHLHQADQFLWDNLEMQCQLFGVPIRERLYCLDEEALVVTGHGANTLLGDEMRSNPFIRA